jgi:glycosyltransferase involved in cell wall biosynthesis
MTRVAYITNAGESSGVGRRAAEIKKRLSTRFNIHEYSLQAEGKYKPLAWVVGGWQLRRKINSKFDIVHATNQSLSFVLPAGGKVVATVHDLIEILEPQSAGANLVAKYLYSGLKRASKIIAVSEYTKKTLIDTLGMAPEQVKVIYNGVDEYFKPLSNFSQTIGYQQLKQELKLPEGAQVLLFVGSEHPRKNLPVALQVLAKLRQRNEKIFLVKVGVPGILAQREKTLQEIDKLKLREAVRLVGEVSAEKLRELYNLAEGLLFPSRFEGFGLPLLEAMACGTPVVAARATSIPEVVGEAGLLEEVDDVEGFAVGVERILQDKAYAEQLRQAGLARAKEFDWQRAAEQEAEVYKSLV